MTVTLGWVNAPAASVSQATMATTMTAFLVRDKVYILATYQLLICNSAKDTSCFNSFKIHLVDLTDHFSVALTKYSKYYTGISTLLFEGVPD